MNYRNEEPRVLEIFKEYNITFSRWEFAYEKEYFGTDCRLLSNYAGISFFGSTKYESVIREISQRIKREFPRLDFYWSLR